MKKLFKFISVIIVFLLSLSIFKLSAGFIAKKHKSHMAKLA